MTQTNQDYAGPGDFKNVPALNTQFNSQPRQQCTVIVDLSRSMMGTPLDQLNLGIKEYYKVIQNDPEALNRVETMIIGFGSDFKVLRKFSTLGEELAPELTECLGGTVFCPSLTYAIQESEKKRTEFKNQGITTGKPVIIFISDGEAWDTRELPAIGEQIKILMDNRKIFFQAFGVESANMDQLNLISHPNIPAKHIGNSENFAALFRKLSASITEKSKELNDPFGSFQMTLS